VITGLQLIYLFLKPAKWVDVVYPIWIGLSFPTYLLFVFPSFFQ
jgi:hypothetical protein